MKKKKKASKIGYMCGVDFNWELCDDNSNSTDIYGSIDALKHNKKCFKECGIVKVTVTVDKWVVKEDFSKVKNGKKIS